MAGPGTALPPLRGAPLIIGTLGVSLATFMTVLDSSIANVSVPAIAGDMGVSPSQGTWVITSFAVANAIAVPLTGWLTQRFGQVRLFVASVLLFVIASWLCGLAPTIESLIFFRVVQGLVPEIVLEVASLGHVVGVEHEAGDVGVVAEVGDAEVEVPHRAVDANAIGDGKALFSRHFDIRRYADSDDHEIGRDRKLLRLEAEALEQLGGALGVRRVVARGRVGGHLHQGLQKAHFLVEVGVDPGVEFLVGGLAHGCSVASWSSRCWKARTHSSVSSLVIASSGLWLMPAFRPRWNSMAWRCPDIRGNPSCMPCSLMPA